MFDGLEIREWGMGYGIFDTLSEKFVSSKASRKRYLQMKLDELRASYRPIIVRWVFGIPTATSREQGIR